MRVLHASAPARVALAGNPSDGFGGRTLSLALDNYRARVTATEASKVEIVPAPQDRSHFGSVGELVGEVRRNGYYGGLRLLTAAVKRFADHCEKRGVDVGGRGVSIRYETDIPRCVGLGGSSAIVAAAIAALIELWGAEVDRAELPDLILSVEAEELGIPAGLQDRVAQVYGGLTYMDFDPRIVQRDGHGRYESLHASRAPLLFIAHLAHAAEPSEVAHADLHQRFDAGDRRVIDAMTELAGLAMTARDAVEAADAAALGDAMDASFDVRSSIATLDPRHAGIVELARELGAPANYAGSGGAIVGIAEDERHLGRIEEAFGAQDCVVAPCRPGTPACVDRAGESDG